MVQSLGINVMSMGSSQAVASIYIGCTNVVEFSTRKASFLDGLDVYMIVGDEGQLSELSRACHRVIPTRSHRKIEILHDTTNSGRQGRTKARPPPIRKQDSENKSNKVVVSQPKPIIRQPPKQIPVEASVITLLRHKADTLLSSGIRDDGCTL